MRKSAQVAALSLFGTMGLDAVIEKVTARMKEIQATRGLADAVDQKLRQSGWAYGSDGMVKPVDLQAEAFGESSECS